MNKPKFNVRSIRRLTADKNHNAFTGAAWFQGALYVAFRQGDAHVCTNGRLVVMRSRDNGVRFDTVAVIRGQFDTRDAHLYSDGGGRLFVAGFEATPDGPAAGAASSDDGLHWSAWKRYSGADGYVMWRPRCRDGRFFCAGYTTKHYAKDWHVAWFESSDGYRWERRRIIHSGFDQPNESPFDFRDDGSIVMLMRRENARRRPLLLRSAPPYTKWDKVELNVKLAGPAIWLVGDDIWIAGRWFLGPNVTHLGVFKLTNDKPELHLVLPSGPGTDMSYMGVARHPDNRSRFALSYYSGHVAGDDPGICQWDHPDIYLADIVFQTEFIAKWQVSDLIEGAALSEEIAEQGTGWRSTKAGDIGFVDATARISKRPGVIIFRTKIEAGPTGSARLCLGYDGNALARLNGKVIHEGSATNPALPDSAIVPVEFIHGVNLLEIALETRGGRACGVFARWEACEGAAPTRKTAATAGVKRKTATRKRTAGKGKVKP